MAEEMDEQDLGSPIIRWLIRVPCQYRYRLIQIHVNTRLDIYI